MGAPALLIRGVSALVVPVALVAKPPRLKLVPALLLKTNMVLVFLMSVLLAKASSWFRTVVPEKVVLFE